MTETVDDAMADIALVFGWPPSVMDPMSLAELMGWRERARLRNGTEEC